MSAQIELSNIDKHYGAFHALKGVSLSIEKGSFVALVGPSGCGKSTLLRSIAGLESISSGTLKIAGESMTGVPPRKRDVAMVFQSYALYPHMTVEQNIAFPLKMVGTPAAEVAAAVRDAAARVGIGHLLARRPGQLSGGQQQRCALARAIVRKPRLFLLDEPLSNLDAKLRLETRAELRRLQRSLGITAVYVTHDQEEAMTVADRMAVFMDGRIVQVGAPKDIFLAPANATVAAFIGTPAMNLLPAQLADGRVEVHGAHLPVAGHEGERRAVTLGIRPADLRLAEEGIAARVEFIEDLGDNLIINFEVQGQRLKARRDRAPGLEEGQQVKLSFDPAAAHLFDGATGERLQPHASSRPTSMATQDAIQGNSQGESRGNDGERRK